MSRSSHEFCQARPLSPRRSAQRAGPGVCRSRRPGWPAGGDDPGGGPGRRGDPDRGVPALRRAGRAPGCGQGGRPGRAGGRDAALPRPAAGTGTTRCRGRWSGWARSAAGTSCSPRASRACSAPPSVRRRTTEAPGVLPSTEPGSPFGSLVETLDELVSVGYLDPADRPMAEITAWSIVHGLSSLLVDGPLVADEATRRRTSTGRSSWSPGAWPPGPTRSADPLPGLRQVRRATSTVTSSRCRRAAGVPWSTAATPADPNSRPSSSRASSRPPEISAAAPWRTPADPARARPGLRIPAPRAPGPARRRCGGRRRGGSRRSPRG